MFLFAKGVVEETRPLPFPDYRVRILEEPRNKKAGCDCGLCLKEFWEGYGYERTRYRAAAAALAARVNIPSSRP